MVKLARINREIKNLKKLFYRRLYVSGRDERSIIQDFHKLYYDSHLFGESWENTKWMGYPARKCPLDFWIYQEIFYEVKPDIIIELGTSRGGSTLFFAQICELIKKGRVVSVDCNKRNNLPAHDLITYVTGPSTDDRIVETVKSLVAPGEVVLVVADSDHHYENVSKELEIYSTLVTTDSYFIVEDGNLNGNPVCAEFGPGPFEATIDFLQKNRNFISDLSREKFYLTFNPKGYLKRIY